MAQTKEEFINENIVIKQWNNGDFFIDSIRCSVLSNVEGNVGNVGGDVGNVGGDVLGLTI